MGTAVEFNTVLALRARGTEGRHTDECISQTLTVGGYYLFMKEGHRIYDVRKKIPLVVTEGEQNFTKILAIVRVFYVSVQTNEGDDIIPVSYCKYPVQTTGKFKVVQLLESLDSAEKLRQLGYSDSI